MSWSQDYSVPSYQELLLKLTEKTPESLTEYLEADLRDRLGISIANTESILVTEGYFEDVRGLRVTLSDGRVFVPKLVETYTEHGNYGRDTYDWVLEGETPEVKHVDGDLEYAEEVENEQELYGGCGDEGCGCGF